MDKGKRKKNSRSRKKRIQLDAGVSSLSSSSKDNPSSSVTSSSHRNTSSGDHDSGQNSSSKAAAGTEKDSAANKEVLKSPTQSGGARPTSPEPDCAICLSKLENKSFTDSCFHMFCFVCLVEWSKVKAECPLCKQPFKSIVHNVRSYEDYDQYHIPRPEERNPSSTVNELLMQQGFRFRYRTTVTDHRYAHLANRIHREIENRLLQRPSVHTPIPSWRRVRQAVNSDFRRNVYIQRLRLRSEQLNTRRRVRETSPTFFRENPAQTHRLVPWLNRELNALLQGHGEQIAFLLDLILGLIKRHPIDSEEFYQHVYPFVGRNTRQFMREFLAFAKSPYHMAAYDRHVSYEENDEPNIDSASDSDHQRVPDNENDGNDSDVMVISPPISRENVRNQPMPTSFTPDLSNLPRTFPSFAPIVRTSGQEDLSTASFGHRHDMFAPPSASGWDSPTPGPSTLQDPMFPVLGSSIWTPATTAYSNPVSQPFIERPLNIPAIFSTPPSSTNTQPLSPTEASNSNSDGSDVEIVEVEKPWNERSPIQLSSAAESDYDVLITGTGHVNDEVKKESKKKKHKKHKRDHLRIKDSGKRRRSRDSPSRMFKKARHRTQSRSVSRSVSRSRSRTRSLSPLRLTLSQDYRHKKFSYRKQDHDEVDDRRRTYSDHYARGSASQRSRSSSTDSKVSVSSHKHKLKSRHLSIEIVDHKKKSSKSKKSKKHKTEKDSSLYKHKHKSKKKKHRKDKSRQKSKESDTLSKDTPVHASKDSVKKGHGIYTSDSDSDSTSDIDVEAYSDENGQVKQKSKKKKQTSCEFMRQKTVNAEIEKNSDTLRLAVKTPGSSSRVAFEEITAAQAAVIDQELDSINRALASNDYIDSLFSNASIQQNSSASHHSDLSESSSMMVNPNEVLNLKRFKKHPFGHKKSGKKSTNTEFSNLHSDARFDSSRLNVPEDTIQSSDITSCSDVDQDRQLPSIRTLVGLSSRFTDTESLYDRQKYDSPTSTNVNCASATESMATEDLDVVDVDTVSDSSDIDVGSDNLDTERSIFPSACSRELEKTAESDHVIDIEGHSDSENDTESKSMDKNDADKVTSCNVICSEVGQAKKFDNSNNLALRVSVPDISQEYQVKEGQDTADSEDKHVNAYNGHQNDNSKFEKQQKLEEADSDIECSLVEGHKTYNIAEDSENEGNRSTSVETNSDVEIDVVANSDDQVTQDTADYVNGSPTSRVDLFDVAINTTLPVNTDDAGNSDNGDSSKEQIGNINKLDVEIPQSPSEAWSGPTLGYENSNLDSSSYSDPFSQDLNTTRQGDHDKSDDTRTLQNNPDETSASENVTSCSNIVWTANPIYEPSSSHTPMQYELDANAVNAVNYLMEDELVWDSEPMSPFYSNSGTPSPGHLEPES